MSITVTFTGSPRDVRADMLALMGAVVATEAGISASHTSTISQRDLPETAVVTDAAPAEQPKAEPEIVPPKRTRVTKKAETVIQPDVTDIDKDGDPVAEPVVDEFAGKSPEEIYDLLTEPMTLVVKVCAEDKLRSILDEHKVKNRTEAAKLPADKLAALVADLRKAVL